MATPLSAEEPCMKRARLEGTRPVVMMNGISGAMGTEIAQTCLRRGVEVAPKALGSGRLQDWEVKEGGKSVTVQLVGPEPEGAQRATLEELAREYGERLVIVDFTNPSRMNESADLYSAAGVAFVMGTTGGDEEQLMKVVKESGVYAVVAPNMAKQIVALQATMARMARDFPGAFSGYKLQVTESHQKTKADTSGTAKALIQSFKELGTSFEEEQVEMLRDEQAQKAFGVPEQFMNGHAWHTYTLKSGDGSVEFQFKHNVNGRRTYAEGVVDAVEFLAAKRAEKSEKKVFTMIDILEAGAMC